MIQCVNEWNSPISQAEEFHIINVDVLTSSTEGAALTLEVWAAQNNFLTEGIVEGRD